jgi:histone H3
MQAAQGQPETTTAMAPAPEKPKKKYRFKPGTVSLREIKKHQKSTTHLIQRKPFYRLVKEIAQQYSSDCKFQQVAMQALQDDAESYITQYFARSQANAIHAGRKTILVTDGQKA